MADDRTVSANPLIVRCWPNRNLQSAMTKSWEFSAAVVLGRATTGIRRFVDDTLNPNAAP